MSMCNQECSDRTKLSRKAQQRIEYWSKYRMNVNRQDWHSYFLSLAKLIAQRSIDAQTKHGCVIVDKNRHIIGTGYNGWIKEIEDNILPNLRPAKYAFMLHAEINALLNCTISTKNSIAYITGKPCVHCFQCLYQAGISEIYYGQQQSHMQLSEEEQIISEILEWLTKDKIILKEIKNV